MTFDYAALRDRWYREGWFSERTLVDALDAGNADYSDVTVDFVTGDVATRATVGTIAQQATALAAGLQCLGIRRGDAVAVQLTNRIECAVAYQAVLRCGAVLVPIVHIYGVAEVRFILAESGASALIMPRQVGSTVYLHRLAQYGDIDTLRHVIVIDAEPGDGYAPWPQLHRESHEYRRPTMRSDDIYLLLYTSGTTSAPKGVQHTHNTVLAEVRTLHQLIACAPDDVSLVTFPPGHMAGVMSTLRPLIDGSRTVFMDGWDAGRAADVIHQFGVTSTVGAPIHLQGLTESTVSHHTLATLREFLVGAAPVSPELVRHAAAAGIATFRSYGSTEHPTVTGRHRDDPAWALTNTDGRPLAGSSIRILAADGHDASTGMDGEVVVQGPQQFVGYRDHRLDSEAFTSDNWFRTGDLGHLDDEGRLTITDRIKDVIIRGGETMSSSQIEDVLYAHPAVREAAVVAAPDLRFGELVAAVVVLEPETELELDEVKRYLCKSGLARQKAPERLLIVDALPRTPLGKVKKAELRRLFEP